MKAIFFISALCSINAVSAQQQPMTIVSTTDTVINKRKPEPFRGFNIVKEENHKIKSLIIPAGLIAYGFTALGNNGLKTLDKTTRYELREEHPAFITKLDNYLQYSPALAVYGLNAFGIKGKNNFRDRTMIYA